jgi:RNA polymerase sigma-70 factor (ECF subfamily)
MPGMFAACLKWRMTTNLRTEPPSEQQLVRQAQLGDKEAFARLYETHKRRVYAICLRITREKAEAEDCAQEAFLQCFQKLPTFRGDSALSTWLYRLTVNVVLMRLRTSHGKPVSLDTGGTQEDSAESTMLNACPVDDLQLTGAIDRIAIHRALRKLPPGYRTIFLLHDVEGKAHSEIARELGCSIGNSKSQLHQARVRLRRFLRRPLGVRSNPGALQYEYSVQ